MRTLRLWALLSLLVAVSVVAPAAAEVCTVRLMVAYSDRTGEKFRDAALDQIQTWVEYANVAFDQSRVDLRLELGRVVKVDYSDDLSDTDCWFLIEHVLDSSNLAPALVESLPDMCEQGAPEPIHRWIHVDRLSDPDDGWLDEIPLLRDAYGIDLTALVLPNLGGGAARWVGAKASGAYCVVPTYGPDTLAHETGHLIGAHHQRGKTLAPPFEPWGHAYLSSEVPGFGFKTIMADGYGPDVPTLQYFSNPLVQVEQAGRWVPTGTFTEVIEDEGKERYLYGEDNARVLNDRARPVARFRPLERDAVVQDHIGSQELLLVTARQSIETLEPRSLPGLTLGFEVEAGGQATFRAGQRIVLRPGFHAKAGSTFRAYLDEDFSAYCDQLID